eukprot:286918_1
MLDVGHLGAVDGAGEDGAVAVLVGGHGLLGEGGELLLVVADQLGGHVGGQGDTGGKDQQDSQEAEDARGDGREPTADVAEAKDGDDDQQGQGQGHNNTGLEGAVAPVVLGSLVGITDDGVQCGRHGGDLLRDDGTGLGVHPLRVFLGDRGNKVAECGGLEDQTVGVAAD